MTNQACCLEESGDGVFSGQIQILILITTFRDKGWKSRMKMESTHRTKNPLRKLCNASPQRKLRFEFTLSETLSSFNYSILIECVLCAGIVLDIKDTATNKTDRKHDIVYGENSKQINKLIYTVVCW